MQLSKQCNLLLKGKQIFKAVTEGSDRKKVLSLRVGDKSTQAVARVSYLWQHLQAKHLTPSLLTSVLAKVVIKTALTMHVKHCSLY